MDNTPGDIDLEVLELDLFLEGVFRHYGYDFRNYSRPSLTRRSRSFLQQEGLGTVSALLDRVLHDRSCFEKFILALTVNVSAMYRDPSFFLALRTNVVPLLRTYPFIRIWCAGCSTGEEVYSLAIMLEEEGLYDRCRIYATDLNEVVLQRAKDGIFPLALMQQYTKNYLAAGGAMSFSEYYSAAYDHAVFLPTLKRHLVFAQHNLVTDGPFNEFHLILCRNVMIYFNKALQERVHNLMYDSLAMFGVLALGDKEAIRFTSHEKDYEHLDGKVKLYRKVV